MSSFHNVQGKMQAKGKQRCLKGGKMMRKRGGFFSGIVNYALAEKTLYGPPM